MYTGDEISKIEPVQKILNTTPNVIISTQVLFEFSNIMYRKFKRSHKDIATALDEFQTLFTIEIIKFDTIKNALRMSEQYKYSFPDSLIIATALEYNCDILFSEDMHHEQIIENRLQIINPFVIE